MATIKDVARLAGTSTSTVSIVINGQSNARKISDATRERVLDAIRELGYTPNRNARSLQKPSLAKTIALFWADDFRTTMLARFLNGLQTGMARLDTPVEIAIHPYPTGKLAQQQALAGIPAFDGAIIANANEDDLAFLADTAFTVPVAVYNRRIPALPWAATDDEQIGRLMAEALAGREHALLLAAEPAFAGMSQRDETFSAACAEQGTAVTSVPLADMTADAGYRAAITAFTYAAHTTSPFDAVYAPGDAAGLGVLRACRELDLAVPDEVAVAAVGNGLPEYAAYSAPSLTTVEVPMEELAEACLELVVQQMDGSAPENCLIPPRLVRRASTF